MELVLEQFTECHIEPIGVVIVWENKENNENFLGCLFTKPDLHSKGIGTQIWKLIEETYPNTCIWRTDTPLFSTRNMNFYINKCGFMAYRIENPRNKEEASVHFIKFTKKWNGYIET